MCLKLNICASLNLSRGHYNCVSGKVSQTDCLQDPVHALCHSWNKTRNTRGSEPLGVDRPVAVRDYTFYLFHCNKVTYR